MYFTSFLPDVHDSSGVVSGMAYPGPVLTTCPPRSFSFSFTVGGRYRPEGVLSMRSSGSISTRSPTIIKFFFVFMVGLNGYAPLCIFPVDCSRGPGAQQQRVPRLVTPPPCDRLTAFLRWA